MYAIHGMLIAFCVFQIISVHETTAAERRDITTLSDVELRAYCDAWRAIQNNRDYAEIAGYHGCPDEYCHNESPYHRFLPWHRAYCLKLEKALQAVDSSVALHYWDWTSDDAVNNGIPHEFTDADYQSEGSTHPNPLRRFAFNCGEQNRNTRRNPLDPSNLLQLRDEVDDAMNRTTYDAFNANNSSPMGIQVPHGNLHGWVRRDMGSTTFAAYDPIFWAHHANVDRQWAAWQESSNGADPSDTIKALPLEPFNMTVEQVLDYRSLGYEYDRLGAALIVFRLASNNGSTVIKNLRVPQQGEALGLYVHDLPEHPEKSYTLFVFVDQPDATVKDAKRDNPNYVGFHHIFGGKHEKADDAEAAAGHREHARTMRILDLSPAVRRVAARRAAADNDEFTLTILATDPSGKKVDTEDLPFKEISVQPSGEAADREAADHARSVDEQAEHVDSVHEESEQKHSDNDEKQ